MKKLFRPLTAALALALLTAGVYAASSGDSLISLSHLRNAFFPGAVQTGEQSANQILQSAYESALDELDAAHSAAVNGGAGGGSGDGYYSGTLQPRSCSDGQVVSLSTGSGFLMLEGTASVSHNGAVIDITDGTETASGAALRSGHRYLVGEDTSAGVTILSGQVQLGIQGSYTLSPGRGRHTPFFDVSQNDWFYAPVNYAYERGLFSGMDENHFDPGGSMNRAMLMSVLHRLAGSPSGSGIDFSDVPDGQWYSQAIRWGASQGITSGTGNGTFTPAGPVTREQTVAMLYNYATKYLKRSAGAVANLSDYQDLSRVNDWARPAMAWAVGQGIVSGVDNGGVLTLEPQRGATRAEMATMLQAFCEKIL